MINIEQLDTKSIKPYSNNNKLHDEKQVELLAKQIKEHGFDVPIVVDKDLTIIKGHGRLLAAKKLKLKQVPCIIRSDLNQNQIQAARIADNKLSESPWDTTNLLKELDELRLEDYDPQLVGFDSWDISTEGKNEVKEGLTDPDEVPEVKETSVVLGDIYQLGSHRLMCGDSTDEATVAKLMNGQKADMVFTDPPYGMDLDVDYDNMFKNDISKHNFTGKRFTKVIGDDKYYSPTHILNHFSYCKEIFLWGADYFFWDLPKKGSVFCWDKRVNENMDKVVGNCLELCWSKSQHKKEVIRMLWSGHHGMQHDDSKKRVHPTQKPAKLSEWFLNKFSKENNIIIDLFLGSGSTLIACEQTNRTCYGMELDPYYCQVIIDRWEKFTGQKAIKL